MADMRTFREAAIGWAAGGSGATAAESAELLGVRTAVLLEGPSDLEAVEALAARHGRDLAAEGVCVLPMGGAMNVGRFAGLLGPAGLGLRLAGLCDENEQGFYERGLERAGGTADGIFVCTADLEDELIRTLGVPRIEEVLRTEGDLPAWQTFVRQPAQRDRPPQQRMRRFLGTKSGRKIRYGRLLTEALDPEQVPAPLRDLLRHL
ncbi:TOPRIM nucleotidyl transferase/hydrolase domain-containing protein [Kitasatospora sp. NPDC036755]|uniref:TOPRIM nucleotidyl transferase/hydrolase domain-containing protein n=1 Tax=Kitasatospora sp. NPDC036755 TaxID=3154600 RepID=UPI0033EA41FB